MRQRADHQMKQGDYFDWEGIAVAEEDKHVEIPLK